jgi:hypothetical protein
MASFCCNTPICYFQLLNASATTTDYYLWRRLSKYQTFEWSGSRTIRNANINVFIQTTNVLTRHNPPPPPPSFLPPQLIWKCIHQPNIIAGYYLIYLLSQDKKIANRRLLMVHKRSVNNRKVQCSTFALRPFHRNITFWTSVAFHGCKLLRSNI